MFHQKVVCLESHLSLDLLNVLHDSLTETLLVGFT